ncbi:MAG: hypothetical protein ACOYBP_09055 [Microbacteriaceae bacterium]
MFHEFKRETSEIILHLAPTRDARRRAESQRQLVKLAEALNMEATNDNAAVIERLLRIIKDCTGG